MCYSNKIQIDMFGYQRVRWWGFFVDQMLDGGVMKDVHAIQKHGKLSRLLETSQRLS